MEQNNTLNVLSISVVTKTC